MTAQIADVVERLEKATGPDRELDAEIYAALNGGVASHRSTSGFRREYSAGVVFEHDLENYAASNFISPNFTSSIDSAMTLVPEGFAVSVEWSPQYPGSAWIFHPDNISDMLFNAEASNPAIALCIASLKARSQP